MWEFVFPHQWGWAGSCLVVGLSKVNLGSERRDRGCGKRGAKHHLMLRQCSSVTSSPQNGLEWEQGAKLQGFGCTIWAAQFCVLYLRTSEGWGLFLEWFWCL